MSRTKRNDEQYERGAGLTVTDQITLFSDTLFLYSLSLALGCEMSPRQALDLNDIGTFITMPNHPNGPTANTKTPQALPEQEIHLQQRRLAV
jgi:hypothetical protein